MAKSVALKSIMDESKKLAKMEEEKSKQEEKIRAMASKVSEEDLEEIVGPINAQIAELDEKKKELQKQKRELLKKVLPSVPRTKSGSWKCDVTKNGKDTVMTVTHTASKKPFEKKFSGNGEDIRKAYTAMRNSFITHFDGAVSQRGAESYLTNTVRPKLGIA